MANATCISSAFKSTSSTSRARSFLRTPVPTAWLHSWLHSHQADSPSHTDSRLCLDFRVEAKGLEPSNLLTASQALYQLSYAPEDV